MVPCVPHTISWARWRGWPKALGYFFPVKNCILGLTNKPLVTERAYRVSTSAYLVYGSLIPQIMETWGWMAALIRSKTNIWKSENIYSQWGIFPEVGSCYFCLYLRNVTFWAKTTFFEQMWSKSSLFRYILCLFSIGRTIGTLQSRQGITLSARPQAIGNRQ